MKLCSAPFAIAHVLTLPAWDRSLFLWHVLWAGWLMSRRAGRARQRETEQGPQSPGRREKGPRRGRSRRTAAVRAASRGCELQVVAVTEQHLEAGAPCRGPQERSFGAWWRG